MSPRHALLPRLVLDGILPCTLAALALAAAFTLQQLRDVDDSAQLRIALQMEQLAAALQQHGDGDAQRLLDEALRRGGAGLRRIELYEADGRSLSSGAPAAAAHARYERRLPAGHGARRLLAMQVDAQARQRERGMVWLLGAFIALGIVSLALLATHALRRRVRHPLQRLQQALNRMLAESPPAARAPEPLREFERLQASAEKIAGRLSAHRIEHAAIQRATAGDALDQLRRSQAASRSKSQFMALVGHHFRQPLQAMQLLSASLHPGIDAEQQALLAQMRGSISAMTRLLDALLEISRLDAGVVAVESARFSVAQLFRHDRAELLGDAHRHAVALSWRGSHDRLLGDVHLTAALLRQLVRNAIAFTPAQGRVLVAARWRPDGVRFEVRDNGSGIAAIQQQRIFEEFVQLHGESERHDGYGLGLSIAARLARVLGTRIELRSEPGRGSTFWFDLRRLPMTRPLAGVDARRTASAAR